MVDSEEELPFSPGKIEVDPEHLRIYKGVRDGSVSPQELSMLLDADSLIEGFLGIKGFERRLQQYLDKGIIGTLIAVDLDYFKLFNDSLGHPAGDDLLKLAGTILHDQTRTSVAEKNVMERRKHRRDEFDLLARGGDEFLVFLVDAEIDDAVKAAKRIRMTIVVKAQQIYPNYDREQTMSLGLSRARDTDDVRSLRKRADDALYEAKRGKDSGIIEESIAIY